MIHVLLGPGPIASDDKVQPAHKSWADIESDDEETFIVKDVRERSVLIQTFFPRKTFIAKDGVRERSVLYTVVEFFSASSES